MSSSVWLFEVQHNKISWGAGVFEPANTTDIILYHLFWDTRTMDRLPKQQQKRQNAKPCTCNIWKSQHPIIVIRICHLKKCSFHSTVPNYHVVHHFLLPNLKHCVDINFQAEINLNVLFHKKQNKDMYFSGTSSLPRSVPIEWKIY